MPLNGLTLLVFAQATQENVVPRRTWISSRRTSYEYRGKLQTKIYGHQDFLRVINDPLLAAGRHGIDT